MSLRQPTSASRPDLRAFARVVLETARQLYVSQTVRRAASVALLTWFVYQAWLTVAGVFTDWPFHFDTVGIDGRLYYRAAATWLAGGDPWTAFTTSNTWPPSNAFVHFLFTGPPPTVLAFAPFAWIPEDAFVVGWLGLSVAAAIYTTRRLHLPIWWVLFPPLINGLAVGNPQIVCLALLLSSSTWARALAAPMKAYAVIPMVGERQWRALGLLALGVAVSVVIFWPLWQTYAGDYSKVQDWLVGFTGGGYSATRDPRLFAITAAAIGVLLVIDRRAALWLAVPALWPATQYFYATFAMPLRSPWLVFVLAAAGTPNASLVPWCIVAYAGCRMVGRLVRGLGLPLPEALDGHAAPAGAQPRAAE
jgi:hypothetical protein